jgi:hypothetical protein
VLLNHREHVDDDDLIYAAVQKYKKQNPAAEVGPENYGISPITG